MIAEGGIGTLYAGLVPLWARQVPYTIIKVRTDSDSGAQLACVG